MNNSTRIYLPPIQDILHHSSMNSVPNDENSDNGAGPLYKKTPSPTLISLSYSAPYPPVPDHSRYEYKAQGHYQSQHSSDYHYKNDHHSSPYQQRDSTDYIKSGNPAPTPHSDWEQRSADNIRKHNGYTNGSKMDQVGATKDGIAEPLQQQQALRMSHSRSFSDQFLRRSSALETTALTARSIHPTSFVDPPRNVHRRAASDVSSLNNRKRRSISSSSGTQDDDSVEHKDGPPHKVANTNRYTCNECFKSFSRPSSLRIHILSHTGEKPHKCPQPDCGRRFSVQSNMRRHLKVHYCNNSPQQRQQQHQNLQTFSSRLQ